MIEALSEFFVLSESVSSVNGVRYTEIVLMMVSPQCGAKPM